MKKSANTVWVGNKSLKVLSSEMDPAESRLCDTSFKEDLSNEPNFGRIHLAGQYL